MCYIAVFCSHWMGDYKHGLWHFCHRFIIGAVGKESDTGLDLVVLCIVQDLMEKRTRFFFFLKKGICAANS